MRPLCGRHKINGHALHASRLCRALACFTGLWSCGFLGAVLERIRKPF